MSQRQLTKHTSVGKRPDRLSHPALTAGRVGHAEEPSDNAGGFSRILRRFLMPLGVTAGSGAIAVIAMTVAACQTPDPTALITPLAAAALGIASIAGGITAGRCSPDNAVGSSLVSGVLLTAILCLIALPGGGDTVDLSTAAAWFIRLSPIPFHLLGGIMARPRKKPASHTAGKHGVHRR